MILTILFTLAFIVLFSWITNVLYGLGDTSMIFPIMGFFTMLIAAIMAIRLIYIIGKYSDYFGAMVQNKIADKTNITVLKVKEDQI